MPYFNVPTTPEGQDLDYLELLRVTSEAYRVRLAARFALDRAPWGTPERERVRAHWLEADRRFLALDDEVKRRCEEHRQREATEPTSAEPSSETRDDLPTSGDRQVCSPAAADFA